MFRRSSVFYWHIFLVYHIAHRYVIGKKNKNLLAKNSQIING
ncbi:hypothetical protein BN938_2971 [Mucinivorans hirudinis]|uniref:Uncharacterized protein n=1 Tax=Mucinivorans hirudinis TaxID=1433126 RepID=A0A060RBK7_9BACT|nr:hypothetical protein BN938_2971 [Mucinivorans hirudinis]